MILLLQTFILRTVHISVISDGFHNSTHQNLCYGLGVHEDECSLETSKCYKYCNEVYTFTKTTLKFCIEVERIRFTLLNRKFQHLVSHFLFLFRCPGIILFTNISSLLHTVFRSPRFGNKGQRVLLFWEKARSPSENITMSLKALSFLLYQKLDSLHFKIVIYIFQALQLSHGLAMTGYFRLCRVPTQVTVRFVVSDFLSCFCNPWDFHFLSAPPHSLSPPCSRI